MAKITFVSAAGTRTEVDVEIGISVMQAARDHNIDGITAECGGCLSCATCHAYVANEWMEKLPPPSEDEKTMVDGAVDVRPNSRLTCQIMVTDAVDGLVIEVPATQY